MLKQAQVVVEVFQKVGVDYATANRLLAPADEWAVLWPSVRLGCKLRSAIEQAIFCPSDAVRAYDALIKNANAGEVSVAAAQHAVERIVKLVRTSEEHDDNNAVRCYVMMALERLCKYARPLVISEADFPATAAVVERQARAALFRGETEPMEPEMLKNIVGGIRLTPKNVVWSSESLVDEQLLAALGPNRAMSIETLLDAHDEKDDVLVLNVGGGYVTQLKPLVDKLSEFKHVRLVDASLNRIGLASNGADYQDALQREFDNIRTLLEELAKRKGILVLSNNPVTSSDGQFFIATLPPELLGHFIFLHEGAQNGVAWQWFFETDRRRDEKIDLVKKLHDEYYSIAQKQVRKDPKLAEMITSFPLRH